MLVLSLKFPEKQPAKTLKIAAAAIPPSSGNPREYLHKPYIAKIESRVIVLHFRPTGDRLIDLWSTGIFIQLDFRGGLQKRML